jgi:midasin
LVDEHDTVVLAQRHITDAQDLFHEWEKSHPQLRLIISPLRNWLASQILHTLRGNQLSDSSDPGSDQVIEALLKSIQSIHSVIPAENQFLIPSQDSYLKDTSYSLIRVGDLLHVDSKVALMHSLIDRLARCPLEGIKRSVSRLLPFIQRYTLLVEEHLLCMARWVNSLVKLQLTACSVMLNVAMNGFCKPPDSEESGEGGTKDESGPAGVGFGEGEGKESVNKEIEDESQVEGLKDESGESQEKRDEGGEDGDDAIEVGDDFQGELESLPESVSEEEQPTNEDEEGPEEALGDLDVGDPDAIDEKLWGDEAGTQEDGKQGKTSEDQPTKASANTEMVAKENERPKDDHHSPEKIHDDCETRDEAMPDDDAEEDNGEEAPGDSGAPLDDFVQDSDVLDLPDGLEMDEDTMGQDPVEEVDDKMFGDEPDPTDSPTGEDKPQPDSFPETPQPIDKATTEESLDGQRQEGDKTEAGQDDFHPEEDVIMQPDVRTGDGTSNDMDVPDSSLDSNFREGSSERPSGSAMGAKAAGMSEEVRGDEMFVHSSFSTFLFF